MEENSEIEIEIETETETEFFERQARERKELEQRAEKLKSCVPKKDRVGRDRINQEIDEMKKALKESHEKERKERGFAPRNDGDGNTQAAATSTKPTENGNSTSRANDAVKSFYPTNNGSQPQQLSKAQLKKQKRKEQEAEKQKQIEAERWDNLSKPTEKQQEDQAFRLLLEPLNMGIHHIPADGNCMYSAISHQLSLLQDTAFLERIYPPLDIKDVMQLRRRVAEYMREHPDDFAPFLDDGSDSHIDLNAYCDRVETRQDCWGGQLELKAFAECLDMVIHVYAVGMPLVVMEKHKGDGVEKYKDDDRPILRLCYHRKMYGLGEHYNSVVVLSKKSNE